MRTLEDWFKYLEQQYVDEKAEREKREEKKESEPPAQREVSPPPTSSASVSERIATLPVQPRRPVEPPGERSAGVQPPLERVQITETPVPDPAEYIFTLRRAASEPTAEPQPSPAEQKQSVEHVQAEPEPPAPSVSEPIAEEVESAAEPPAEEAPAEESQTRDERPARAKATRRAPYTRSVRPVPPPQSIEELWKRVPKHVRLLVEMGDDEVTQRYYDRRFKESRQELVERLLNPSLTLEDTARLLGVCPTTVRRYTERGLLNHYRTPGNQRRFRLSDVIAFLEARQQAQEARRRKR
ncbi:MAG: helix-turn-helix domain-containing protein [Chthonomonadetes bacterium]|nr:helix-turn-helix domain-containing protein [Chthonomonadetes bacterium]